MIDPGRHLQLRKLVKQGDRLGCGRFCVHQDWLFHEAGGGVCNESDLDLGSSSTPFALSTNGVSVTQAVRDRLAHENVLRNWTKESAAD